jgi:hypothetical protein
MSSIQPYSLFAKTIFEKIIPQVNNTIQAMMLATRSHPVSFRGVHNRGEWINGILIQSRMAIPVIITNEEFLSL